MDGKNLSYEPMEVDLSSQSASFMDISYTDTVDLSIVKTEPPDLDNSVIEYGSEVKPETLHKLVLSNFPSGSSHVERTNFKFRPMIIISSMLLVSILTYQIVNFDCYENVNINIFRHNLITKLHGQTIAVNNIISALESKDNRKILFIYGGTGVGKTFAVSLMLEKMLDHKNIYHYTMPSFLQTFSPEFRLGLLFCKSAILVVDDLRTNDVMHIKPLLKELILKSMNLSKNVTIILIYNCDIVKENFFRKCDESFHLELAKSLEDVDAKKYFIKFYPLTQEHLRNCIKDELADQNASKNIDIIERHFNVTLDGCKGVHQKLQYMKIL